MGKSLGDYNIEKSSSYNVNNIKWSQKNPLDAEKPKKKNADKRFQNSSASNCNIQQGFERPAR
jgi:hypothetical protein